MEIEFTLNRKEYLEFLKLAYARMTRIGKGNSKFFALNVLVWIFIGMGLTGIFRFYKTYEGLDFKHLNLALVFLAISAIGLFAVAIYQRKFYLYYALNEDGHMLKRQKAKFTYDEIDIVTADTSQSFSWSSIQGKECSKNLICLYIDNSQALILPKRVFSGDGQIKEICELIDNRISSNNQVNKDAAR
jgi:hypothetical protein